MSPLQSLKFDLEFQLLWAASPSMETREYH